MADFSRRRGVVHREIMAPDGAEPWVTNREELWNRAEATERRKDAQLAREIELALPHELTHDQRLELLRAYVQRNFVARGMVADIAIHEPHSDAAGDKRNVHAHVMLTLRGLRGSGFGPKVREWNEKHQVSHWREGWAEAQNDSLERAGHSARVDHRSYAAQGIAQTPQIHEGPKTRRMKQRGYEPASRIIERRTRFGSRYTMDYRRHDQGRTRRERNLQIAWSNHARRTAGARMAKLVEAHIHRTKLHDAWNAARSAGKQMREARQSNRSARESVQRAAAVVQAHRERIRDLAQLAYQSDDSSEALHAYIRFRCFMLQRAAARLRSRRDTARAAQKRLKQAAVRYRNIKSRLGDTQAAAIRKHVEQRHEQALRAVSNTDIRRSGLPDRARDDLLRAHRWLHSRDRDDGAEH